MRLFLVIGLFFIPSTFCADRDPGLDTLEALVTINMSLPAIQSFIDRYPHLVNQETSKGELLLHTAAYWGYLDIVDYLIATGTQVNKIEKESEQTALQCATITILCGEKHKQIIKKIIEARARLDEQSFIDIQRHAPELLPLACVSNYANVRFLIKQNAYSEEIKKERFTLERERARAIKNTKK